MTNSWLGAWIPPESGDDASALSVGKTARKCSCNHQECDHFREESWCRRFFTIRFGCKDVDRRRVETDVDLAVTTLREVVQSSLATRSYQDFAFQIIDLPGMESEWFLVVMLAEGQPPLTTKELMSWIHHAAAATVSLDQGTCYVKMMRATCCLFEARKSLLRLLNLYRYHSREGRCMKKSLSETGVLGELIAKVEDALGQPCGDTDVAEGDQDDDKLVCEHGFCD